MISALIELVKGTIKEPFPEKPDWTSLYELIKKELVICVIGLKLYFECGICFVAVSDNDAILVIRAAFEDSNWQAYLGAGVMKKIINGLKTDPDLQKAEEDFSHPEYIRFKNEVWDIKSGTYLHKTDNLLFSRYIDASPSEQLCEESPVLCDFCMSVFSEEKAKAKKRVLYEIIGFLISDLPNIKKAVFFIGVPNSGKSVMLRFISRLVGEGNVSHVSLSEFSQRFSIVEMYGKALNTCGEVPAAPMSGKALDVFKSITGGDKMQLESKGRQPFSGIVTAKILCAGNNLPTFTKIDGTSSVIERIHVLRFDNSVEDEDRDLQLEEKLWAERDLIVRHALEALKDFVLHDMNFIMLDDEIQMLELLYDMTNPIQSFIESCIIFGEEYAVHVTDVYDAYCEFAKNNALPELERTEFKNLMIAQPDIKIGKKRRLGKKSPRICFEGIKLSNMGYDLIS